MRVKQEAVLQSPGGGAGGWNQLVLEWEVPESGLSPHLQPQLWGQGFVLWIWVWLVVWRNSPAGELPGGALLPRGPQRAGRLLLAADPTVPTRWNPQGTYLESEPSAVGEALHTPPAAIVSSRCAVLLLKAHFAPLLVL